MDPVRFDQFARKLGMRRSRRSLFGVVGAGLATIVAPNRLAAQEATPEPEVSEESTPAPQAGDPMFLFVQVATSGTWVPHPDDPALYTLTLDHAVEQTVFFSDRPERIVGTVPTAQFLESLGFTPDNPPNAALVAQTDTGEAVVVLELFNPRLEVAIGEEVDVRLTYDARVLAEYTQSDLTGLVNEESIQQHLPETFGQASLLIDDCAERTFFCWEPSRRCWPGEIGKHGMCWHSSTLACRACDPEGMNALCNQTYPICNGVCSAYHSGVVSASDATPACP